MIKKFKFTLAAVCAAGIGLSSNIYAKNKENFSNVITFGDSFATPDNSFAALISKKYGYGFVTGANNFAQGGASTADLAAQLDTYKAAAKFNPNALYMMYMGPNDMVQMGVDYQNDILGLMARGLTIDQIIDQFKDKSLSASDLPQSTAYSADVQQRVEDFIQNLTEGGANYIVALNHFNEAYRQHLIGGLSDEQSLYFGNQLSSIFNEAIYNAVKNSGNANVIYADYAKLVEELSSEPSKYFTAAELTGTFKNLGVFDATSHPTEAAQKITANYVASIVEAPSRVAYVRELAIMSGTNVLQNIRSFSYDRAFAEKSDFLTANFGADYNFSKTKSISKKQLGFKKSNGGDVNAHLNYNINEEASVGVLLNASKSNIDFVKKTGKAKVTEFLVALDGTYKFDDAIFLYAGVGAGVLKYNIHRHIMLGLDKRVEHGSTKGRHYLGTVGAGYKYAASENLSVTPFVDLNYQNVSMKNYKELGNSSTAMSFKIPDRTSLIAQIGATLDSKIAMNEKLVLTPALSLSYGYDFKDSIKKKAQGVVKSFDRYFSVPTYKSDKSNISVQASVKAQTSNMLSFGIQARLVKTKRTTQTGVGLFGNVNF